MQVKFGDATLTSEMVGDSLVVKGVQYLKFNLHPAVGRFKSNKPGLQSCLSITLNEPCFLLASMYLKFQTRSPQSHPAQIVS